MEFLLHLAYSQPGNGNPKVLFEIIVAHLSIFSDRDDAVSLAGSIVGLSPEWAPSWA